MIVLGERDFSCFSRNCRRLNVSHCTLDLADIFVRSHNTNTLVCKLFSQRSVTIAAEPPVVADANAIQKVFTPPIRKVRPTPCGSRFRHSVRHQE